MTNIITKGKRGRRRSSLVSPLFLTPPVITGTAVNGSTVSVSVSSYGSPSITVGYMWRIRGANTGITTSTYVCQLADVGATDLECDVTLTGPTGTVPKTVRTAQRSVASAGSPPGQVTGLTLGTVTASSVALSWNATATAIDYLPQYSLHNANSWTTFNDGISTATSCVITGLSNSTVYDFQVIAVNSNGNGTPSAISSTATLSSGGGGPFTGEVGTYGAPADTGRTCDPTVDAVAYSSSVTYAFGDMVLDSGFYYISDVDGNVGNALTDTSKWWKCTQFLYLDTTADNVATPGVVSSNPATAKAAPFNTFNQVMQKTTGAYPASMDVNSVVLLKRGQTYEGAIRNQATKTGYVDPVLGGTAHARYFYGVWGSAAAARPRLKYANINSYVSAGNAAMSWASVGARYYQLDFDGQSAWSLSIASSTGINVGDIITGSTTGAQYQVLAMNATWNTWTVLNTRNVGGAQSAAFSVTKTGSDSTGLANNTTVYTATIVVNGVSKPISVVGSAAQTFTQLISELNTDLGASATASITGGTIVVTSATTGSQSTISITAGSLFPALTNYTGLNTAVPGGKIDFGVSEAFTGNNGGSGVTGSYAQYRISPVDGPGATKGYWKIMYCTVRNFTGNGLSLNWSAVGDVNNVTVIGNTIRDTCIWGGSGGGLFGNGDGHKIQRNSFWDNGRDETFSHAVYMADITNTDISYNYMTITATMKGNHGLIVHGNGTQFVYVHDNLMDSMTDGIGFNDGYPSTSPPESFNDVYIYNNILRKIGTFSAGGGLVFDLACSVDFWVYNNLCYDNKGVVSLQDTRGISGDTNDQKSNRIHLHNNTFAFKTTGGYVNVAGALSQNFDLRNNIIYGQAAGTPVFQKVAAFPAAQLTMVNNLLFNPNTTSVVRWEPDGNAAGVQTYNQSTFNGATGKNASGIQSDPLFTNFSTFDLTLQSGSPAKLAGTATGVVSGYSTDFAGTTQTTPPSIGCFV